MLLPILISEIMSKLSDGRTGEVVLINGHALSRPIVKCEGNEFVDLSKERNLEIVAVLQ